MSIFEPVIISWRGKQYTIPANKVLRAIAIIEDHLTLVELTRYMRQGAAPLAKIAQAFAGVINFASGEQTLTADEVYAGMFGSAEENAHAQVAVGALLAMMVPPNARPVADEAIEKNSGGAAPASKPLSKRRSRGASRRQNFGA